MTQKKLTQQYLERAAMHYLGRYASSVDNLRAVLVRKAKRRLPHYNDYSDAHGVWIEAVIEKCLRQGYLDDQVYAEQRVRGLHMAGKSERSIIATLKAKGVARDIIDKAIDAFKQEEGEDTAYRAALTYARKRRFGAYRTVPPALVDRDLRQKEFAAMARVGFAFDVIKRVINAEDDDDFEI